jgi:hypothetical protein
MFQFPGLATSNLCIQYDVSVITHGRLPDSEISGLTLVSSSPELFAAVHVLRRLLAPRHPPRALRSLTVSLRHASSALPSSRMRRLSRTGFEQRTRTLLSLPATLDDAFIVWTAFSFLFYCQRTCEVTYGVIPRDCLRIALDSTSVSRTHCAARRFPRDGLWLSWWS